MKEKYHKFLLAGFAAIIAFAAGYILGFISSLNWVIKTAAEHFGFNVTIDRGELSQAIFRYMNQIG
jgi:hypothetical protein